MSKRNFTLLIITVIAMLAIGFGSLYFYNSIKMTPTTGTQGTNFVSRFFPFLSTAPKAPEVTPPANVSGYQTAVVAEVPKAKLTKVSSQPVAGFGVFMKERFKEVPIVITPVSVAPTTSIVTTTTTTTKKTKAAPVVKPTTPPTEFVPAVRYVGRATGNIYQTFADKIEERKFTTTIIPMVYEASFGNKGESVIMRYLKTDDKTIETFTGSLPKEVLGADTTGDNEIKGSFFPENISDLSISFDTLSLFYLFNIGDGTVGITSGILGDKKSQVFNSPFTEWLSQYPSTKMITLTTKPSANVPGYMYAIDPNKKDFNKILGNINGLTTLTSPSGKLVLYSNNNLSLSIYNMDTRSSNPLGLKTLPEKCTWNKTSDALYCSVPKFVDQLGYPDVWYQGQVSFSDQIWKINVTNNSAILVADPASVAGGEDMDGIKLAVDDGENYLFFINKNNSYLWKLDLK